MGRLIINSQLFQIFNKVADPKYGIEIGFVPWITLERVSKVHQSDVQEVLGLPDWTIRVALVDDQDGGGEEAVHLLVFHQAQDEVQPLYDGTNDIIATHVSLVEEFPQSYI